MVGLARPRGRLWLALALLGLAGGVYVLAVGVPQGRAADDAMRPDDAEGTMWRVLLGVVAETLRAPTLALATIAIVATAWRRGGPQLAIGCLLVLVGANATTFGLEAVLSATDPLGAEALRGLGSGFFPSGHATAALSLGLTVVPAAGGRHRRVAWTAGAYAAAVGVALVAVESHTPSDVLGGFLVAAAWAAAVLPARPRHQADLLPAWAPAAAGVVAAALALAALLVQPPSNAILPFVVAAAGLSAATFLLTRVVAVAVEPSLRETTARAPA